MKLVYNVKDKPKFGQLIVFAIQQLLAIMAATIVVPVIINGNTAGAANGGSQMSMAAALFGAGVGTLVYLLFTAFKSPVFLGSSFAFLGSMTAAFAGAVSAQAGYAGLILGAVFAGLAYVVIAIIVKFAGVKWVNKLMPAVVIGPTVAIIGLSLAGAAINDLNTAPAGGDARIAIVCGLVTLIVTILCSVYGKKTLKMIPFIIGIVAGYICATIFTVIGDLAGLPALKVINFDLFKELLTAEGNIGVETFVSLPKFTFMEAINGVKDIDGAYIATVAVAYVPVALVVFAEHIADHKNISSIIEKDLLEDPGLDKTLLGDGVGSMAGAFFGGCPNTTYGESVGCVAISGNASVITMRYGGSRHRVLLPDAFHRLLAHDPELRDGRRLHGALRLHRRVRFEDGTESRPGRQRQPLHGFRDPDRGHRRLGADLRQSHHYLDRLRADPGYHREYHYLR